VTEGPDQDQQDFVLIGIVRRPHGTAGEVSVEPVSEAIERFEHLERVLIRDGRGTRSVAVKSARRSGERMLMQFEGIGDREAARALASAEIGVRRQDVWPLPQDCYYIFEVVGCRVFGVDGRDIGVVEDVMDLPANDVLVVRTEKGEALVPVTRNVIRKVDLKGKCIVIEEIEGLLDLQ
jgi:16S rRNA processing protein RimM